MRFLFCLIVLLFAGAASVNAAESAACPVGSSCSDNLPTAIAAAFSSINWDTFTIPSPTCLADCSCTPVTDTMQLVCLRVRDMRVDAIYNSIATSIAADPTIYGTVAATASSNITAAFSGLTTQDQAKAATLTPNLVTWWNFKMCRNQSVCYVSGAPVADGTKLPASVNTLAACNNYNGTGLCVNAMVKPSLTASCTGTPTLLNTKASPAKDACVILSSSAFDLTAFNDYYTLTCPADNTCQNVPPTDPSYATKFISQDTVAGLLALAEGNRYGAAKYCEDYVRDYVHAQVPADIWTPARYQLIWNCKIAFGPAGTRDQLKADITKWEEKVCDMTCDSTTAHPYTIVDTSVKDFCTGTPDTYPWPLLIDYSLL
ncbi:MAG: hypothetical protein WCO69_03955 [Candidatus Omnitrophota bacterium]